MSSQSPSPELDSLLGEKLNNASRRDAGEPVPKYSNLAHASLEGAMVLIDKALDEVGVAHKSIDEAANFAYCPRGRENYAPTHPACIISGKAPALIFEDPDYNAEFGWGLPRAYLDEQGNEVPLLYELHS